jgi:anti-sigma regulatory factor (Ser/Thr protein kinase)
MHGGHAPEGSAPPFECEVPACSRSLAGLRASFTAWLTALGVADLARRDLVLTISELASAALDDASAAGHWLHVDAWSDDEGIAIEVSDDRGAIDGPVRGPDPGDRGAGLAVVATLAEVLTVRACKGGRAMRARIRWEDLASPVSR